MARTNSLGFPNLIDVTRNCVNVIEDNVSIVNRSRLLILTEPTELYNDPTFGVGLKRHLWQYNTDNQKAMIRDRIAEQLSEHEPCVDAAKTAFADGLLFTGSNDELSQMQDNNRLKMTIGLSTVYGDSVEVSLNSSADVMYSSMGNATVIREYSST